MGGVRRGRAGSGGRAKAREGSGADGHRRAGGAQGGHREIGGAGGGGDVRGDGARRAGIPLTRPIHQYTGSKGRGFAKFTPVILYGGRAATIPLELEFTFVKCSVYKCKHEVFTNVN